MKKIFVVIPTFNEVENLPQILGQLFTLSFDKEQPCQMSVLVVDDNSPDGTGELVEKLRERYPNLEVLHREKKEGLGRAYLAGFGYVLTKGADLVVEMDADGSHQVADLHRLIDAADGVDVVVGSRYVKGGSVDYPWYRVLISKLANNFANFILRLGVKDATSGFKAYRRGVAELFLKDDFSSSGYSFQVETLLRAKRAGFKIKEVPITFVDRTKGKSKMRFKEIWEGSWRVLRLGFSAKGGSASGGR